MRPFIPLHPEAPILKAGDGWQIRFQHTKKSGPVTKGLCKGKRSKAMPVALVYPVRGKKHRHSGRGVTGFTKKVYTAVAGIPLGQVRTYKWVAEKCGHPKAYRAVGQILKRNPYPLIIPCHRVAASGKKLGGYSGGIKNKKMLINLERQIREFLL